VGGAPFPARGPQFSSRPPKKNWAFSIKGPKKKFVDATSYQRFHGLFKLPTIKLGENNNRRVRRMGTYTTKEIGQKDMGKELQ